jgi:hypothetical protein
LVLTVSHRLSLLLKHAQVKDSSLDLTTLHRGAIRVLNGWAKRIESEGLAVSLDAIAENALWSFSLPGNAEELASIGDRLIDSAEEIESLLCGERLTQSLKTMILPKPENAAKSGHEVPWGEAAKEITGLVNVTDATWKLQQLFHHLLKWDNPEEGWAYRKLLTEGINGTRPGIPEQLVPELKERFLRDKEFLRNAARK